MIALPHQVRPGARWLTHLAVSLVMAAFVAALYRSLLFTNRVLATGDILLYFYPYRDYASALLRQGQIPLWNPYLFLGAPFLANPQAAVLYPLHWPLIWLPVTAQIYWSAALHTWLIGLGGYVLLRRWGYGVWAGLGAGLILAGSGFFGGLIGHLNQMNTFAWLPWALATLPVRRETPEGDFNGRRSTVVDLRIPGNVPLREWATRTLIGVAALGLIVALILLAGHSQSAYISLFGLGIWALAQSLFIRSEESKRSGSAGTAMSLAARLRRVCFWPQPLIILSCGIMLGAVLSAAQLLPTLEVSGLGLRSGGLDYLDATSFSLKPLHLGWTLLPSYGLVDLEAVFDTPAFSEFIAYVGLIGFGLALLGVWKGRGVARRFGVLFALLGLFLALGRWNPFYYLLYEFIPGFDLFRTPARWMMLYTLGVAALVGSAVERLVQQPPQFFASATQKMGGWSLPSALIMLLMVDLLIAAFSLPAAHPTAPQAVDELRTAPAHLLTDPARTLHPAAAGRFLGMSAITYDPGDMADLRHIYRAGAPPQLSEREFADLIIALKVQELIAPNLPLLWRIPAVDGYDGGVLPLLRYNQLLSLFAPQQKLTPDGRLREQLEEMPHAALLGLLNVTHVVTDKVRDLWFEDVFYDRQIGARLTADAPALTVETPQSFVATHVDVIGAVEAPPDELARWQDKAELAATVLVQTETGVEELQLTAGGEPGANFADDALNSQLAARGGATVALRDVEAGRQEYRARLPLSRLAAPQQLEFIHSGAPLAVIIRAVTLYDDTTGMFLPLLPSDRGRFRLVHSGDVKIYENLDALPRAYLVHRTLSADDANDALTLLADVADPRQVAVVEGMLPLEGDLDAQATAKVVAYAPERVEIRTQSAEEALLVLSDSYYPGWTATVDGAPAEVFPTNVLFRSVRLGPGEHTVVFAFAPATWRWGLAISLAGLVFAIALIAVAASINLRRPVQPGV